MKKEIKRSFYLSLILILTFILWTVLVSIVDKKDIGPTGSSVGFATVNQFVHSITGVHMWLYTLTDWLGLVPVAFMLGFFVLGVIQWIKRRSIFKVDYSILVLGGYYIIVTLAYVLFEEVVVNFRPVLINGYLEASYPSSTTLLVLCIMPTTIMQLSARIKNRTLKRTTSYILGAFSVFMVVGRLISGVHWLSDIIGGVLLSLGLVMLYKAIINSFNS